jgi:hypothetical protein
MGVAGCVLGKYDFKLCGLWAKVVVCQFVCGRHDI